MCAGGVPERSKQGGVEKPEDRTAPNTLASGGVAERSKVAALKAVRRASASWVRIPPPPFSLLSAFVGRQAPEADSVIVKMGVCDGGNRARRPPSRLREPPAPLASRLDLASGTRRFLQIGRAEGPRGRKCRRDLEVCDHAPARNSRTRAEPGYCPRYQVLGDLCKRRGEIAAAERDDPLPVPPSAVRDCSGLHVLLAGLESEPPPSTVARVDS
jgi:hypothetical protein